MPKPWLPGGMSVPRCRWRPELADNRPRAKRPENPSNSAVSGLWGAFGDACVRPWGSCRGHPAPLRGAPRSPDAQPPLQARQTPYAWWNHVVLEPPSYRPYAARRQRRWSRASVARPNIWRCSILRRWMWPSTGPLLQARVLPALTASSSSRIPCANRCRGVRGLSAARASHGSSWSGWCARRSCAKSWAQARATATSGGGARNWASWAASSASCLSGRCSTSQVARRAVRWRADGSATAGKGCRGRRCRGGWPWAWHRRWVERATVTSRPE